MKQKEREAQEKALPNLENLLKFSRKSNQSLSERLADLPPGQVLDVSNIDERGMKVRNIARPKKAHKNMGVPGLGIVSSDLTHYQKALDLLVTSETLTADQARTYLDQYKTLSNPSSVTKSATRSSKGGVVIDARIMEMYRTSSEKSEKKESVKPQRKIVAPKKAVVEAPKPAPVPEPVPTPQPPVQQAKPKMMIKPSVSLKGR
mgnify:FL=1